jgi:multiple antibiotic resistance protein
MGNAGSAGTGWQDEFFQPWQGFVVFFQRLVQRGNRFGFEQLKAGDGQLAAQVEQLVLCLHQQPVHPIGQLLAKQHAKQHAKQRQHTVRVAAFSAFAVIAICALIGLQILEFFGISLASFHVGGGLLLLTAALSMISAQPAESKVAQGEVKDASARASIAVVPLTIPLLTGPTTLSTVVIYANQAQTIFPHAALVGYSVVIALATAVCFTLAEPIACFLGRTGINVMTRLMGLITAALSVE